jgi:hypothetical protein
VQRAARSWKVSAPPGPAPVIGGKFGSARPVCGTTIGGGTSVRVCGTAKGCCGTTPRFCGAGKGSGYTGFEEPRRTTGFDEPRRIMYFRAGRFFPGFTLPFSGVMMLMPSSSERAWPGIAGIAMASASKTISGYLRPIAIR